MIFELLCQSILFLDCLAFNGFFLSRYEFAHSQCVYNSIVYTFFVFKCVFVVCVCVSDKDPLEKYNRNTIPFKWKSFMVVHT